ncbi:MAG: cation:proton antiporter [Desulfopila sp.]
MHEHTLVLLAAILLIGMACQWLAWRVKLPAILFLLVSGMLVGPVLGWLDPDQLFGDLLFPFVSLAVAVILFEGSLTLKFEDIPGLEKVIRNMITIGVVLTWLLTAIATRLLLNFSWEVALLFGALMVVTGPTVIVPMLRTVRPRENVAHILRWEGILIDPIGAILAVLVFQFIVAGGVQGGFTAGIAVFGKILAIGLVTGAAGGYLFGSILRRHWLPQYLHNFTALVLVCAVFAISDVLESESGLLSVTVMGIWLANMKGVEMEEILDFKESLSVLLISMLFILLAARMDLKAFLPLGWSALAVFGAIQFLSRPLSVHASAVGSSLSMAERHLLCWIAPRGIVAAAISVLFAMKLAAIGYPQAEQMVPLTFMVIIGTVLLQSFTAGPIAKWLKVAEPEPKGFLIVGADCVAQAIARELEKNGFRALLADANWADIRTAKMEGLATYWGNPLSEHAERHLNLLGIGQLLALTPNRELNALAAEHYRLEFDPAHIYSIRTNQQENNGTAERSVSKLGGRALFNEQITYACLARLIGGGVELKTTPLTEEFSYEEYLRQSEGQRVPLFLIDESSDRIHPLTTDSDRTPKSGWKVVGLKITAELAAAVFREKEGERSSLARRSAGASRDKALQPG